MDQTNFSESASNNSQSVKMDPKWIGILEAVILFCIMILAVVGNFLVVAVVYRRRELRRTETHIFIVNLSLTDIFVALLCMPFSIITAVTQKWIFSNSLCQLNGFLNVFFLLTSILTLTAISIHKYIGVVQPTKKKIFTRKRTICVVVWVWFQAFVTALTPILGWNSYEYIPGRTQCSVKVPRNNKLSELTNCLFIIVCGFVIPLGIMSFSYLKIFQTVKIHTKRVRSHSFGSEEQSAFLNERRITITLFIILAVFLACWTPFSVLTLYATLAGNELPKYFSVVAYWFGFLNSAMNPVIYALRTKEFRQGYRQIFGIILPCCFQRIESRDSDSLAVLRGRKSLKSEVRSTLKRRGQTQRESHIQGSENGTFVNNCTGKRTQRKGTLSEDWEDSNNRLQDSLYTEGEESCGPVKVVPVDAVKIDGIEVHQNGGFVHKEEKSDNSKEFGESEERTFLNSNDDIASEYLSPVRGNMWWDSKNFSNSETVSRNLQDNGKKRRKSTSVMTAVQEHEERKRRLCRSKSDCSKISNGSERDRSFSCPLVDILKQTSDPWLRENFSYLNKIASSELEEKSDGFD